MCGGRGYQRNEELHSESGSHCRSQGPKGRAGNRVNDHNPHLGVRAWTQVDSVDSLVSLLMALSLLVVQGYQARIELGGGLHLLALFPHFLRVARPGGHRMLVSLPICDRLPPLIRGIVLSRKVART